MIPVDLEFHGGSSVQHPYKFHISLLKFQLVYRWIGKRINKHNVISYPYNLYRFISGNKMTHTSELARSL